MAAISWQSIFSREFPAFTLSAASTADSALLAWVLAVWVSITFMHSVAERLTGFVSVPSVRLARGFFFFTAFRNN